MSVNYVEMNRVVQEQPSNMQFEEYVIPQNYQSTTYETEKGGCFYVIRALCLVMLAFIFFPFLTCAIWCYASCSLSGRQWFFKQLRGCYLDCCCKFDCLSNVPLYSLIKRYQDDPVPGVNTVIDTIRKNHLIVAVMKTLNTEMPDLFFSFFPSGSLRERFGKMLPSTSVLATDFDIMFIPDAIEIGYENEAGKAFSLLRADNFAQGHFWLKLNDNFLTQWSHLCLKRYYKDAGYNFLSSQRLHDHLRTVLETSRDIKSAAWTYYYENVSDLNITLKQSGPAMTFEVSASKSNKVKCCGIICNEWRKKRKLLEADFTFAIHCTFWPEEANDFFEENRRRYWPADDALKKIKAAKCHVVPKRSTEALIKISLEQAPITRWGLSPGMEWRYSFTQAEIFLSDYLPEPARTSFLALKAVNKKYLCKNRGDKMASYILKTVLFYEVEKKDADYWKGEETLVVEDFFLTLVKALTECLYNRQCPHYWIPVINLLAGHSAQDCTRKAICCESLVTRPKDFVGDNWLEYTRCLRYNCCFCGDSAVIPVYDLVQMQREEEELPCACCSVKYEYSNKDSCCGPCGFNSIDFDVY